MDEKRYDAAMVFLLRAGQVGDSEMQRKSNDTVQRLKAQHAGALQEGHPEGRQVLFCTREIPSWIPEEFCFASVDTLRGTAWKFEVSHPQPDRFYVCHPLRPDRYYELEGFHDQVFDDKRNELVRLLQSIGATHVHVEAFRRSVQERSVTTGQVQDVGASEYGLGVSGVHSDERRVSELRQVSQSETEDLHLQPVSAPHIPDDLVWYPHEPKWQNIAQSALAGGLKRVTVRLEYHEDFAINAKRVKQISSGLGLFSHQAGVHWSKETEERLQQRKDTIWEFTASFP